MVEARERRIVVGVDGSESSVRALAWAAGHAELTGSVVEAIATWEWPSSFGFGLVVPEGWSPADDAQKVLDKAIEQVAPAHPGLTIRTRIVEGHPAPALVEASTGAELLVVGSRGHGEFAGMLLGSVSEHCVTHAHCPVLVVREES
ncbi:MAG TPA: universal stress protein [Acidimicrobiales bacterium]|nr:universal stress protein [Acidimicrobiales bacterium]